MEECVCGAEGGVRRTPQTRVMIAHIAPHNASDLTLATTADIARHSRRIASGDARGTSER